MTARKYEHVTLQVCEDQLGLLLPRSGGGTPLSWTFPVGVIRQAELLTAKVFSTLASQESVAWWQQAVQLIGDTLYRLLPGAEKNFIKNLGDHMKEFDEGTVCRVALDFREDNTADVAKALGMLPWEFMYLPKELNPRQEKVGAYLGTDHRFTLYRKISGEGLEAKQRASKEVVRLLLVVADPAKEPRVNVSGLLDALDEAGHATQVQDLEALIYEEKLDGPRLEYFVAFNPDGAELQRLVAAGPRWDIIHFAGHSGFERRPEEEGGGGKVGLVRTEEVNGEIRQVLDPVDAATFADYLRTPTRPDGESIENTFTDLVVLQTCEGAAGDETLWSGFRGIAHQLAKRGFPAVAALQYEVRNSTANEFAATFYRRVLAGDPIDVAVQTARRMLKKEADEAEYVTRDFASPVLFAHDPDVVFFPKAVAEPAPDATTADQPTTAQKRKGEESRGTPQPVRTTLVLDSDAPDPGDASTDAIVGSPRSIESEAKGNDHG